MCDPRQEARRHDGFTVVEVVFASAILFLAFTALMSLVVASTTMNAKAKEKASMTNAANTYIEQVRGMRYDDVGTPGGDPTGTVVPSTVTLNGYVITISPTITWVDDAAIPGTHNYKKIVLAVSMYPVGNPSNKMSYTVQAMLKATDSGSNSSAQRPVIDFSWDSPSPNQIVYGTAVTIGAIAAANGTNVRLTSVNFYCDGIPLKNTFGVTAQWAVDSAGATKSFQWDTTATNDDGNPLSVNGNHVIKIECWDSNGKVSYAQRNVLVDNTPPPTPVWITANLISKTDSFTVAWARVMNGNLPTDHYKLRVSKADSTGAWGIVQDYTNVVTTSTVYSAPSTLSLYKFSVLAASRNDFRVSEAPTECVAVSRPFVTGTYTNTMVKDTGGTKHDKWSEVATITVGTASFPVSSISHQLYRASNSAMTGSTLILTSSSSSIVTSIPQTLDQLPAYYYQVKTVVTPVGWPSFTVYSNVLGPNLTQTATTTAFPNVGW